MRSHTSLGQVLVAIAMWLLVGACGIGGGEPAMTLPYQVTAAEQLAVRITKDTPELLSWEVACMGTGSYSKVAVRARSSTFRGTYSSERGRQCERAGQRLLSGELAKRDSLHNGDVLQLSLEAVTADGTSLITGQGSFTQGSDGRLRPR